MFPSLRLQLTQRRSQYGGQRRTRRCEINCCTLFRLYLPHCFPRRLSLRSPQYIHHSWYELGHWFEDRSA